MGVKQRPTRRELVELLVKRDGTKCQYPGCGNELDPLATGSREITIDHWICQSWAYENGWTYEQVWDLSNLKLMEKKCNAKKGDQLPNEDGTIPERKQRTFRYRRDKRATRPDQPCISCDNGHNLFIDEVCAQCGCDAQRFPRSAKVRADECTHDITWCWACSIGITPRAGAIEMLFGLGGIIEGHENGLEHDPKMLNDD